jgi:integrase
MAARWLADIDGSDRAPGTKRLYRFVTASYLLPAIGDLRLREVTVPALDRLLTSVHSAHGPAAAKTTRSVLSGILGLAVRHGLLATNPVRETPARRGPRDSRRRPRALTIEETHQLRVRLADDPTAVRQDLPDLVASLLGTGLRIGEACAVRPTDLDVDAGTLTVAGTVTRDQPTPGPAHPGAAQDRRRPAHYHAAAADTRPPTPSPGPPARRSRRPTDEFRGPARSIRSYQSPHRPGDPP